MVQQLKKQHCENENSQQEDPRFESQISQEFACSSLVYMGFYPGAPVFPHNQKICCIGDTKWSMGASVHVCPVMDWLSAQGV